MGSRAQTHCLDGHEFTPKNTYWQRRVTGIYRRCRACTLQGNKEWDVMKRKNPRQRKKLANGWLHISEAADMGFSGYMDDQRVPGVLVWVVGRGVMIGCIYETPHGLIYSVPGIRGDVRFGGWQPAPLSPRARPRALRFGDSLRRARKLGDAERQAKKE